MAKSCGAPDGGNQDASSSPPDAISRDATDAGPSGARPDPVEALERPVEAIELGPVEIEIDGGGVDVDVDDEDDAAVDGDDEIVDDDDDDSNERILIDNRTPDRATCRPNSVAKKPPRRLKSETERFLRSNLFADKTKAVRSPSERDSCDDERVEHDDDTEDDAAPDDDERPDSVIEVDGESACDVDGSNPRTRRKRKLEPRSDAFPHKKPFGGGSETTTTSPAAADRSHRCRAVIPTRDNPPPEMAGWLDRFEHWSNAERLLALDALVSLCEPTQVRHVMRTIEPQFQRDFISLLPRELALTVLSFLGPKDLLTAARTCRGWRTLADDNLLWRDVCRRAGVDAPISAERSQARRRGRGRSPAPVHASPWKAAFMRRHVIDFNWRSAPLREPKVLKGHDDHVITCLQFCGNRIVSGSDDNTLKVWSATTGRCLRTLVGHTGGVWSSQMRGSVIVSGSTDRTLKVWNAETGACVHTLYGHTSTVRCMHLHGDRVVSGSRDATLRVWDVATGECLRVLVGHHAAVRCVQYDGRLIVSGAYDYTVKVWCAEREECLHTLTGHRNRVYSLQFDGVHVVSGSLDTSIRVWCAESGALKSTLVGHQSLTSGMELRGDVLVSGNADSTVKVWDVASGRCLRTLAGPNKHRSAVTCLQFDGRHVVTSSDDGTVKLWDVRTGAFVRDLVALDSGGSGGVVWRIRASETKLVCAVGSRNGTEETKLLVLDFDVDAADATPPSTQVPSDPFAEPAPDA